MIFDALKNIRPISILGKKKELKDHFYVTEFLKFNVLIYTLYDHY